MKAIVKKADIVPVRCGISEDAARRREMVGKLAIVQRTPPDEVARKLGVQVKVVLNDLEIIRKEGEERFLSADPNKSPVRQLAHDVMTSSDVRARMLWEQLDTMRQSYDELIASGPDADAATMLLRAKLARQLETAMRSVLTEIRAEERHKVEALQKLGVAQPRVQIQQQLTVRDETPLVQAVANFINQEIQDPDERRKLRHGLQQRLRATIGPPQ